MAERAESVGVPGGGLPVVDDVARRRPQYGVVFCELPPPDPGARRAAETPAPRSRSEYKRGRRQAIAATDQEWCPYVSADAARWHLAALGKAGVGLKSVARLSGVSHGSLSKIVYGEPRRGRPPSRRIRPETLERILGVSAAQARGGQRVDAEPTWRLIEELVAAGYTRAQLARELGSQAASPTLQLGRDLVRASTARAVEDLHRRLIRRPGPGRARRRR